MVAADTAGSTAAADGEPPRRRARRRRRRRPARRDGDGSLPPSTPEDSGGDEPDPDVPSAGTPSGAATRPICVIDRSTRMDNTEVDLQRALVVTIGGNRPSLVADRVLREVARSYNLAEGTIQVTPFAPEDFLLLLPDREVAERVYNGGRPFHDPGFTLLFKRWSRLAQADTAALPTFVEGELLGVPAHAWELATAQKLLGGSSWVQALHPDTAAKRDMSSFKFSAWCVRPELIPPVVDLIIPEPTDALVEVPPRKRGLVYPIHLAVAVGGSSQETPPSPPPSDAGQERRRRRRRRRSPSPRSPSRGPTSSSAGVQPRQSVQSRLGPPPASFNHVALADAFAAREASPQVVIAASSAAVRETSPPAAASPLPSASISLQNGGAVMMEKVPQAAGGSRLAAPGPFAVPETAAGAPSVMAAVSSPGSLGAAPSLVELGPMVDATASFGGPEPDGLMPSLVGPGLVEVAAAQPAVQSNFSPSPRLCAETPSLSDACTPRPAGLPPLMLVEPQAPEIADCGSAPALQVYSRRRGRGGGDTAPPLAVEEQQPPLQALITPKALFLNKVAKAVGSVLPAPNISKRRTKILPEGTPPPLRRSRRKAGLCPETIQPAQAQAKKGVMRSLGLVTTRECIQQHELEAYGRLFQHPLLDFHIDALASLFGLGPPMEEVAGTAA